MALKMDDASFQCLTCRKVIAQNAMTAHLEDSEHKILYQQYCETAGIQVNDPKQTPETVEDMQKEKKPTKKEKGKKEMLNEMPEGEKVKESPDTEKKQDDTNEDKMGETEKDIRMSHQNKEGEDVKPNVTALVKKPVDDFIVTIATVRHMTGRDKIINEKYCVDLFSFMMLTTRGPGLRCEACEMNLSLSMVDEHKNTSRHVTIVNDALVVCSEESEFIREIRTNVFHCGFCNHLESSWGTMESHLKSTAHREAKTAANMRLQEYAPMIAPHMAEHQMELERFSRMLVAMFTDN